MDIRFKLPVQLVEIFGEDLNGIIRDIDSIRLAPNGKFVLKKIKEYIIQRHILLKEDIEKEIKVSGAYTLVDLSKTPEIKYINFSTLLATKMEDSIQESDWTHLHGIIEAGFK